MNKKINQVIIMYKFGVRLLKNRLYPLSIPDTAHVEHGQIVIVRTEKGEEIVKALRISEAVWEKWGKNLPEPVFLIRVLSTKEFKVLDEIKQINTSVEDSLHKTTLETEVLNLLRLQEEYKTKNTAIATLNKALKDINEVSLSIEENEALFKRLSATFKKEMPEICPLCKTVLNKK